MTRFGTALIGLLAFAGPAAAGELVPLQATSIAMGEVTGVAYYTVNEGEYRVVATLADGENGTPMRVEALLSDGDHIRLSVPQAEGETSMNVEIARIGDAVSVSDAGDLMN